ncbi:type II secretion system F family protein [Propionivibrio sp.]|uniref:type II secretion system F family protein n=1 Tax=Propionivibrio sp. TaxID=2212460 RepID=UPI003BF00A61
MRFELRVIRPDTRATTLLLDAACADDAADQARQQGYSILKIKVTRTLANMASSDARSFPLGLFSQELLMLLEAGLSIVDSIETLKEKESNAQRQHLLAQLVACLYEGQSLSQALQHFPAVFPPLYIATVRASEKTGDLPEALGRYVAYQSQLDVVRKKVISAAIYPMLLVTVGSLVILFLLSYVVPRFSRLFEDLGGNVPFSSRLLINWGNLVHDHGWALFIGIVGVLAGTIFWLMQAGTRRWIFDRLTALPAIGERMRMYQLARFYRTVGMLLRGGMSIMPSLQMTADLLQGPLRDRLSASANQIREGMQISSAMESFGLTTPVSLRMLRVGERTGRMGEMMERIATYYDSEIARWVDWFVRLFEPLLMAFIGIVIGAIVVMMYFPIFELAGSIQ